MTVFKFELGELTDCDAVGVLAQVSRLRCSGSACAGCEAVGVLAAVRALANAGEQNLAEWFKGVNECMNRLVYELRAWGCGVILC